MIAAYNDMEAGFSPVSLGQAPWLPRVFTEAIRFVRGCVRREQHAAQKRITSRTGSR